MTMIVILWCSLAAIVIGAVVLTVIQIREYRAWSQAGGKIQIAKDIQSRLRLTIFSQDGSRFHAASLERDQVTLLRDDLSKFLEGAN